MALSDPILFGEWMPDAIALGNPGITTAKNVLPKVDGYGPFKSLSEIGAALGAECIGAKSFLSSTGAICTFAGTATGLYKYFEGAWTDVTRVSGGAYASIAGDFWDFAAFGDLVIATNYRDDVQSFLMNTDTDFSQMSATAPKARRVGVIGDFVFLLDVVDSVDGTVGNRVWWSPIANPKGTWASSQTTQCDFDDLSEDSSPCVAIAGSQDAGMIMKGTSLYRVQYVGPPAVFSIEQIEQERGSKLPLSVIGDSRNCYYKAEDGFYFWNGNQSIPIGQGKVDSWFNENFDSSYGNRMQAAIDPIRKLVAWAFPGPGNTGGRPNFMLIYCWAFNKWALIEQEIECLIRSFGEELTLEDLDAYYASIDDMPFSLDSAAWRTNASLFGAISINHKLALFDGTNMTGYITTSEQQLNPQGKAYVKEIEPIIDYETEVTIAVGYRDRQSAAITWTAELSVFSETGVANPDIEAKYHQARFTMSGNNWTRIKGFKVGAEATGDA